MARRSLRVSSAVTPRSSSKRPASSEEAGKATPASKRAKRQSAAKASESSSLESSEQDDEDTEDLSEGNASSFEGSEVEESDDEEAANSAAFDDEATGIRRGGSYAKGQKFKAAASGNGKGEGKGELWGPGVKTGLEPGTQVIIKKPRARSPGATHYEDDTIHPNTYLFLKDLAANNDRQWLKMHDPDYRASWKDFESFLEALTVKITAVDETVPELPIKDIIFRIYRDVRFSKDQTPYKTAFSAAWSRTGRKGPYAVYYLQLKPNGGSMIAGGLWMPEAAALSALRRDIDRRPQRLKTVLGAPNIRKEFLGGVSKDERKVVKKFVNEHAETNLKTKPKGYDADHKDIELLRLRNFTLHRKLSDDEILRPSAIGRITELISHLVPFITYLNSVVRPDGTPESGSDEDEDQGPEDD